MSTLLDEGRLMTVLRRCFSISAIVLGLALALSLLPLALVVLPVVDLIRDSKDGSLRDLRWLTVRAAAFGLVYLICETVGILVCLLIWLVTGFGRARKSFLDWNFLLQVRWGVALKTAAILLWGMRERVGGLDEIGKGPMIVFIRHSSLADTVLPVSYLSDRLGIRLRWVLKRPLLWDPCLDIVGNRLPNCFVERGSQASAEEAQKIGALARGLAIGEGVLIYPEGTRFTEDKRAKFIERLEAAGNTLHAERARRLQHTLLPQVGGALALLAASDGAEPEVDAVFCSHYGFEGATSVRGLLDGELLDQTFGTRFWKVDRERIPEDEESRIEWLFDEWERVERWVTDSVVLKKRAETRP